MCGIAGIYAYHDAASPPDGDELLRIRNKMAARGPDGFGTWRSEDHRIALRATEIVVERIYGKPAQTLEHEAGRDMLDALAERLQQRLNGDGGGCKRR